MITVKDITRGDTIAQDDDGFLLEGAFYFAPDQVDMSHLIITRRTYTCPYKGTCQWIDLDGAYGTVPNVAWVYTQPRPEYEHIRDLIGFEFGIRPGVMVTK